MRRVAALLPVFIVSVLALTINSNQEVNLHDDKTLSILIKTNVQSWFISTPADNNCTKLPADIKQNVGPLDDSICSQASNTISISFIFNIEELEFRWRLVPGPVPVSGPWWWWTMSWRAASVMTRVVSTSTWSTMWSPGWRWTPSKCKLLPSFWICNWIKSQQLNHNHNNQFIKCTNCSYFNKITQLIFTAFYQHLLERLLQSLTDNVHTFGPEQLSVHMAMVTCHHLTAVPRGPRVPPSCSAPRQPDHGPPRLPGVGVAQHWRQQPQNPTCELVRNHGVDTV